MQSPIGARLRPNSMGVTFLEKQRLATDRTFPGKKPKESENLSLPQTPPMQATQIAGAIWALNRCICLRTFGLEPECHGPSRLCFSCSLQYAHCRS